MRLAPIALLLATGCGGGQVVVAIPSDLSSLFDLVAAVTVDASGDPTALSGLTRLDAGAHLEIAVEDPAGIAVDLVGWKREDVPGYAASDPEQARVVSLTIADRCDAALPIPRGARRIRGEGEATSGALRLVSPIVPAEPCLPGWAEQISVELRCLTSYCPPQIAVHGCEATVDLQACGVGRFTVSATDGAPCVTPLDDDCNGERDVASGARQMTCSVADGACDLRFYPATIRAGPPSPAPR